MVLTLYISAKARCMIEPRAARLVAGRRTPLPSVAPSSEILGWQADPPLPLSFHRDAGGNFTVSLGAGRALVISPGCEADFLRPLSIELLPAGPSTCLLLSVGEPGSQRHMLVAAGGSRPAERVRGRLRDLRVDEVDVLVLTHIDSDAVAGAVRILEDPDLMVDEVWFNDRSGAAWGAMS